MKFRGTFLVLGLPTAIGLWFIYSFALTYLGSDVSQFGIYIPRHQWLQAHVIGGIAALLLGPVQLWLGLNRRIPLVHRILGMSYVGGAAVSATAAYYLALHTDFGWVFGLGLASMATASIITTAMATIAICRRLIEQHREWMIRSYVVTFGFVVFRLLDFGLDIANVGTILEQKAAASWMCWTLPLLIAETIIQGWKVFARKARPASIEEPAAQSAATPEPADFAVPGPGSSYGASRGV